MAEVFAIVASSLTVVELFGKTISGIQKIHHFSNSIHNVPKRLVEAVAELRLLGLVLNQLQDNLRVQSEGTATHELLLHCFHLVKDLEDMFVKLQARLGHEKQAKRHWASLQSYLQKESIDDIYRRLERAIIMLNLAISDHRLVTQQRTILSVSHEAEGTAAKEVNQASHVDSKSRTRNQAAWKQYTPTTNYYLSCFLGVLSYNSRTQTVTYRNDDQTTKYDKRRVVNWTILPSTWVRQWGVSVLNVKNDLCQELYLTPIRVVPDSSPIFDACRKGNVEEISHILNNSLATIHDTSQWGWTLLHIAAMHAQADMCRWLLQKGCNSNNVDAKNGWTPLLAISALSGQTTRDSLFRKRKEFGILQPPSSPHSSSSIQDVVRLLIEEGEYDPMDLSTNGWSSLNEYSGPVEPFKYLIEQQNKFVVNFKSFSIDQHNDLAWSLADQFWKNSAELLMVALNNGLAPNVNENFQPVWNRYRACTLLHIEAKRLDRYVYEGWPLEYSKQVIAHYVKNGADTNFRDSFGATPLDDILSYKGKEENTGQKYIALQEWLSLLEKLGLDVNAYLAREEIMHDSGLVIHAKHYRPNIERRFKVERESSRTSIVVADNVVNRSSYSFPGSWVEGWAGFEKDLLGRYVCRDTGLCDEFKVSVAIQVR